MKNHICGDPNSPCDCACMEKAIEAKDAERQRQLALNIASLCGIARGLEVMGQDVLSRQLLLVADNIKRLSL